ncbi:MAG: DNA polymerase I [Armatimonadetes bacterium]|nr:DNA polymerase I [Armatimonadota bacterium]
MSLTLPGMTDSMTETPPPSTSETLYLIDGFAQIFRAYYAIRGGMRSPVTGEPTHAVFGFTGMLLKLLREFRPHYVVVATECEGKTFRDDLYPDYKGTRAEIPDDLIAQIPRVFEITEAFGIPVIGAPGLEADDVIATITQRVLDDGCCGDLNIRIVSKDKDLEQLLGDWVTMFDIHNDATIDAAALRENKGIRPDQVIDMLALMGDTVDNVPGVDGIGPKTAAQLIQQYGSIDGIYENIGQIKGKRRENLEKARAHLPLSRELVTLKRAEEFPFSLEAARIRPMDLNRLIPLFQQLGFNRFQDEARRLALDAGETPTTEGLSDLVNVSDPFSIEGNGEDAAPSNGVEEFDHGGNGQYEAITAREALEELAATLRSQPMIAVDTETTGLERDAKLCGLSFAWEAGHGVYVPILSPEPETHLDEETVLDVLGPVLSDPVVEKCGHNLKFDAQVLLRHGVRLRGVVFDTMLASILMDPSQPAHKLDHLAAEHLRYRMIPITDLIGSGDEQTSIDKVPVDRVTTYAAEDADIALRLYHHLCPKLEERGMVKLVREIESPLAPILAEMEQNGILCDPEELRRQGEILKARAQELRREIQELCGCEFHVDSTHQLAEVLFDKLGFASAKKTKTGRSTDISVLEKLAAQEDRNDPRTAVPRLVIEYRMLTKLISTYLGNLIASVDKETGRIHSQFHQLVTATGRLASHNPNLQNIPVRTDTGRQIRKAFVAPEGACLICADYSQVELRLLAHLSEDPALLDAFERGLDIHTAVAAQVFGVGEGEVTREQRAKAKTINFGIIYGITAFGLARRVEGLDVAGAGALIEDYKRRFPGIDGFMRRCVTEALEAGYVRTVTGRRRAIPEIRERSRTKQMLGERLAINSVVQGSAADLIKAAMVRVMARVEGEGLPLKLLLQIHDELVFEAPAGEAEALAKVVCEEMEAAMSLRVPLVAEAGIGSDWMSAK